MNASSRHLLRHAVRSLMTAIASASLYAPAHPQVQRLRADALKSLAEALEAEEEISLMVLEDELIVAGEPLDRGLHIGRLVTLLSARGVGHLKFLRGITAGEIETLATALSALNGGSELRSTEHIRLGRVEVRFSGEGEETVTGTPAEVARFMDLFEGVSRHHRLNAAGLTEIVGGFIVALQNQTLPLMALAPLREMDEYTFTHSVNVCILNLAQAMSMGIDGLPLQEIGVAGLLHDMGKMFVPLEVLNKPGKLDEREWEQMRLHPVKGARCLLETPGVPRLAAVVAFEHHMKYDFSGYPAAPDTWRQHLASQMTAISDFFDALRTRRAYRSSLELREVAGILLEQHGREFHPILTRNFLQLLSRMMA